MNDKLKRVEEFLNNRLADETYFVILSVVLAFGILQTLGVGLGTERPVVTVISTSMCPALQVGDILLVKNTSYSEIEEGDIVVFDVPDTATINIDGETYTLKKNSKEFPSEVNTSIGTIKLRDVQRGESESRDRAFLTINGELPVIGDSKTALVEGETYNIQSHQLEIEYLTDLPYENVPIVHRALKKTEDHLETKGDNNPAQLEFEDNVRPEQVYGTVFTRIPRIGLVKIVAMDMLGYSGDKPLVIDNTPWCG